MSRITLLLAATLVAAPLTGALACERFGTQLLCDVRGVPVTFGTQVDDSAAVERRMQGFAAAITRSSGDEDGVFIQRCTNDPSTCKRTGGETYCY